MSFVKVHIGNDIVAFGLLLDFLNGLSNLFSLNLIIIVYWSINELLSGVVVLGVFFVSPTVIISESRVLEGLINFSVGRGFHGFSSLFNPIKFTLGVFQVFLNILRRYSTIRNFTSSYDFWSNWWYPLLGFSEFWNFFRFSKILFIR